MKKFSLLWLTGLLALGVAGCGGGGAQESAEDYPSDDIDLLVPYAAGGPADLASRTIGSYYEEEFGETVVVENQPGAAGAVAMNDLISSEPDGHTIKLIAAPATVVTPLDEDVGYEPDQFEPIGIVTEIPSVLAVQGDSEYDSAEELFEAAEESPGEINVGTPGSTTSQNIELQRLDEEYGVEVSPVPFDGSTEQTSALLGGNVDAVLINASEDVLSNIEAGEFKPLAISSAERVDYLPDVPTLSELGYEDLTLSTSLFGLAAPEETPPEIIGLLEEKLEEALEQPEVQEQLGEEYVPEEFVGSEEFQERLDEIIEVYEPLLSE